MKKFLPYILIILFVLVGLFGSTAKANAQGVLVNCKFPDGTIEQINYAECLDRGGGALVTCELSDGTQEQLTQEECNERNGGTVSESKPNSRSDFEKEITKNECSMTPVGDGTFWPGCFIQASYGIFYAIPAFLLWLSAYFFNVLVSITLYSKLFAGSTFISEAWAVVRDLSNIFFILILLYIAIKIILDLGGAEAKKMIARVIVIALLINFSMFFTGIIIDSANILALIFYNKIDVQTKNENGTPRDYSSATGEKDVAGGLVKAFDPTRLLTKEFFDKAKIQEVPGYSPIIRDQVPPGILIGITIVAGLLMGFAAYCFLWAGFAFVGRMIELFVLIIFSPFAFMSFTVPKLASIEYLGWEAWLKRLLKVSFMAPIFMFFLYFIFMLVKKDIFGGFIDPSNESMIATILLIVIPATIILILLLKATEFAKKGSGKLGEVLMTGAKVVGGVALGAVTGGVALAATSLIGGTAASVAGSEGLKTAATKGGLKGFGARMALKTADYGSKASFDLGKAPVAGTLIKKAGLDLQSAKILGLGPREGGYKGAVERQTMALKKESELYKTKKTDKELLAEQEEYDTKTGRKAALETAKKAHGGNLNDEQLSAFNKEFEIKNGPRPYATTRETNDARMRAFKDSLGSRLNFGIGADAGKAAFSKDLEKGFGQMKKITDKMDENKKEMGRLTDFMEKFVDHGLVIKDKNGALSVDMDEVGKAIAKSELNGQTAKTRYEDLVRRGVSENDERMTSLKNTMFQSTIDLNELNKLKTAPERIKQINKENYDYGKDQSALAEKQAAEAKPKENPKKEGGGHAPKASAPKHEEHPPAAPAAHPTPPAGGGEHEASSGGHGH
ncbi:MAG: O-antigen polymerase [Candidatus Paceibacterota bacterium]